MFNFSMTELIVVLGVALLVFGPSRLPEIGRAVGKGIREFKDATNGTKEEAGKNTVTEASAPKENTK
ncbi:MAG TPA: twin-arginine translocase TatA/TatE family subunit [Selenomonadales bacterium]|nr:twin-arginine translocase TatA/TatE family subunit [Selenomonadales bacterium]